MKSMQLLLLHLQLVCHCYNNLENFLKRSYRYIIRTLSLTGIKQLKCPTCASTLVIETNELSEMHSGTEAAPVHNNKYMEMPERVNLQHSESVSSIGKYISFVKCDCYIEIFSICI